jgi:hypothetical protein
MKLEYYKTALHNIQLARDNNYPKSKLGKLTEREQRCLNKIRAGKSKEDGFQKHEDAKKVLLGETLPANEKFPFYVANCLYLDKSDEFGYHIRTKEDLNVGTIVAAERHLVSSMIEDRSYERCDHCKSRGLLNLLPCDSCVRAMYCSEKCRQEAFECYHMHTCGSDDIFSENSTCMLKLFCFGLNCFDNPTEFGKFLEEVGKSRVTAWDMDFRGLSQKEVNKKLFQAANSVKQDKSVILSQTEDKLKDYAEYIAFITGLLFNFLKFKDVLVTEEQRDILRNFAYWQYLIQNDHFIFCGWNRPTESSFYSLLGMGSLTLTYYFNHSCAPNIYQFYDDSKVHFIVLRPIKKGEQLFIEYGMKNFLTAAFNERQEYLNINHFKCKCEACVNPEEYPLAEHLQMKDFRTLAQYYNLPRRKILLECDLDTTLKHYGSICRYLNESDQYYPSEETYRLQTLFKKCIRNFCTFDDYKDV